MSIDQVIDLGNKIVQPSLSFHQSLYLAVFAAIFLCLGLLLSHLSLSPGGGLSISSIGLILVAIFLVINISHFNKENSKYNQEVEAWKKNVAIPYIDSLQVEKHELVYLKVDPELGSNVEGNLIFGSGNISTTPIELTPISYMYKDGTRLLSRTDWVETHMELSDGESAYIEFKRLPKDLGHGILAGNYDKKLFLPQSYKFTEIK